MMVQLTSLFLIIASASAAPAVIWRSEIDDISSPIHRSDDVSSEALFADLLTNEPVDSPLAAVVFLFGRGTGGNESLSTFASQGALPNIASKQSSAHCVHHHVSGIRSGASMVSDASRLGHNAMFIDLNELPKKLFMLAETSEEFEVSSTGMMSKTVKAANKRTRQLASSNVLIVNVDANTDPKEIDTAIVSAIENKSIKNVVMSGVRSHKEVIYEREMQGRRRLEIMHKAGSNVLSAKRRRLDGVEADDANQVSSDVSGKYYVSLTPNILAGILSFFLFATVAYIGISCMGIISGQDVFVSKMPAVGREA